MFKEIKERKGSSSYHSVSAKKTETEFHILLTVHPEAIVGFQPT
jgi:hypothetical protein